MSYKLDLTNKQFGRLTALFDTGQRKNNKVVWHCRCECGTEKDIVSTDLTSDNTTSCGCYHIQRCKMIGKSNKNRKSSQIINEIGNTYGWLTVIEEAPSEKSRACWKCQCTCGNIVIVKGKYLRNGDTKSCGCIKSSGEQKIADLLNQARIPFMKEKKFDNCVFKDTKCFARFDFFVNNQYIIEYDGAQHFQKSNKYYSKERVERDAFKNQWCFDNNIPLIRIPYTHYDQLTVNDLLLETSKFIIKMEDLKGKTGETQTQKTQQNTEGQSAGRPEKPDQEKSEKTISNREAMS